AFRAPLCGGKRAPHGSFGRPPTGSLPAALRCDQVVKGVDLGVEQIEIPLTVDAVLADRRGLPHRHRIVEMNAPSTAPLLVLSRVEAALTRSPPSKASGSKI